MDARAAVLESPVEAADFAASRPAEVEVIEVAEPGPAEVRVEVAAAGLCHTDLNIVLGESDETYPLVMGHEGAGVVEAVGERVTTVSPGDHVVLGRMACGSCPDCRSGRMNLCDVRRTASAAGSLRGGGVRFSRDGDPVHHCHGVSSFTEATVVNEEVAIPVTDAVPLDRACLLGCGVFTGFGAATNTAAVEVGSSVVVFGCGGVGLNAVQGAAMAGADPVIAVDLVAEKLALAEQLGATHTVDAGGDDVAGAVRAVAGGGADYAIICVGAAAAIEQGLAAIGKRGEVVVVGVPPPGRTPDLDVYELMRAEQAVRGSFNGSYNLPVAIPRLADLAASGKLQLDPLVSSVRPLDELNDAMAELEGGTGIRHVLTP